MWGKKGKGGGTCSSISFRERNAQEEDANKYDETTVEFKGNLHFLEISCLKCCIKDIIKMDVSIILGARASDNFK